MKHIIDMLIRGEDIINMVVFRITICFTFSLCILCVRNKLLKFNQKKSRCSPHRLLLLNLIVCISCVLKFQLNYL